MSIWYSTGSSSRDLPNERKISVWLHKFHGKIAIHPSVTGVTQLVIRKFIQYPPSSLQTCLKYTQLFDLIPEILGYTTPTLYPADAPWSQLSKKRIISNQSLALFEKIAAACEEPARNWDRRPKIGIFQSNALHRALIQNHPRTCKISISQKVQDIFWKYFGCSM